MRKAVVRLLDWIGRGQTAASVCKWLGVTGGVGFVAGFVAWWERTPWTAIIALAFLGCLVTVVVLYVFQLARDRYGWFEEQYAGVKYTGTQIVTWSNEPFDVRSDVQLGTAAVLCQMWTATIDQVDLWLPADAPLSIDEPRPDEAYRIGGGMEISFPIAGQQGVDLRAASSSMVQRGPYSFFRTGNRSHAITIGVRKFMVTLVSVRDGSGRSPHTGHQRKFYEYKFSVEER